MTEISGRKSEVSKTSALCASLFALSFLGALIFTLSLPAEAQQPKKVPRIGYLTTAARLADAPRVEALRQGLRDLGYLEGKNINIEYRYAEGKLERVPELAEELVRLKVDILVVSGIATAEPARQVTTTIPIVVAGAGNPIGSGLVASLARPGGNVTGLYQFSPELLGKRLELLNEITPKVSRFAFLNGTDAPAAKSMFFKEGQVVAKALGVQFQLIEVKAQNPDLEAAFRIMAKDGIGALVTESSGIVNFHLKKILHLVEQNHLPAMHSDQEWANAGGLMSYGANRLYLYRRVGLYVDKILKGANPAELPMEQPTKFEFVINLKTAKQIGLTIPPNVLLRADKVIR